MKPAAIQRSIVAFLRGNFRDDGAEGESVHALCNDFEEVLAERDAAVAEARALRSELDAALDVQLRLVSNANDEVDALKAALNDTIVRWSDAEVAGYKRERALRVALFAHVDWYGGAPHHRDDCPEDGQCGACRADALVNVALGPERYQTCGRPERSAAVGTCTGCDVAALAPPPQAEPSEPKRATHCPRCGAEYHWNERHVRCVGSGQPSGGAWGRR